MASEPEPPVLPVLLGVAGAPQVVARSLSPRIFAAAFAAAGIEGYYVPLAIRERAVRKALRSLPRLGFLGANVTMPYKAVAAEVAHTSSELVQRTGVANTLIVREGGQIHAEATDGLAFTSALEVAGAVVDGATVLVIGAGGAATEAAFAAAGAGARRIEIWNRSVERADTLAAALGGAFAHLDLQVHGELPIHVAAHVLVSAVPAAVLPQAAVNAMDMGSALVVDFAYDAESPSTPLIDGARTRGLQVVDGRELLVRQAAAAFRLWFGSEPPMEEMERAIG